MVTGFREAIHTASILIAPTRRRRNGVVASLTALLVGVGVWTVSVSGLNLRGMNDIGLMSVLPWPAFGALGCLVAGFAVTLAWNGAPRWLPGVYPATFVALVYGTPAWLYESPRYAWTWKHVGIVDYIDRTGTVDPTIDVLGVYHNWPGFFAFNALLKDLSGADSALSYAAWAEPFFNLLGLAAVAAVFRSLTNDSKTIALSCWIFATANWVGQGYFAPQALAFLWYVVVIAILLRWFPGRSAEDLPPSATMRLRGLGLMFVVVFLLAGIVTIHQVTPIVMILVLAGLTGFRETSATGLVLLTTVLTLIWALFVATPFTRHNIAAVLAAVGNIDGNLQGSLIGYGQASSGQVLVSVMARALSLIVVLLAALGALRSWREGHRPVSALVLAVAPFGIIVLSSYGHEVLFRAYLFALPGLAFLAARLFLLPGWIANSVRTTVVPIVSAVLAVGFLFANLGNERKYYFTRDEVAAAQFVYQSAPPGSLMVEGSGNYPGQFRNYERFTYVRIAEEPDPTKKMVARDPVGVLYQWLNNSRYTASYLIVTRAQKAEDAALNRMPGGLGAVENALLASPRFRVLFHNKDATVFTVVRELS